MTDRERLIEILRVPIYPHELADPAEVVAAYLLDNGVTFATDNNVGDKWIPVTERLPEERGFYLTARKRDVFVEQWNGVWFSERCHLTQPTHWMPLPEPPKGE